MGDRFIIDRECIYCGKMNKEIYYAPTSGFVMFKCKDCSKHNFINEMLNAVRLEDVEFSDIEDTIYSTANFMDDEQIVNLAGELHERVEKQRDRQNDLGNKN